MCMKKIVRLCSVMLLIGLSGFMFNSCVEEEQNPFEVGFADSEDGFMAKLPNPNSVSFRVGDEVVLKGSGFSESDEVYLEFKCLESELGDINYDGIINDYNTGKVKATVKNVTDSELTFVVPEEMDPSLSSIYEFETTVYITHNGKEARLGILRTHSINGYFDSHNNELRISDYPLSPDAQVYLQYFVKGENGTRPTLVGKKINVEILSANENEIVAKFNHGLGNLKIIYEYNGERAICGEANFKSEDFLQIDMSSFNRGQSYTLPWNGCMEDDEIYLADSNRTRYVKTEITGFTENDFTILIPSTIETGVNYQLILKRYGLEYIMNRTYISIYY